MLRLLLLAFAIYLATRIVGGLFKPAKPSDEVRGTSKNTPLDLSEDDVIDIDFKETKDK